MTIADVVAIGFRNAFIVIGFVCIFIGLIAREVNELHRGIGMALVVVGALMVVAATLGRLWHFW
jgi:hypothetical protein